jgi:hypothetical protein
MNRMQAAASHSEPRGAANDNISNFLALGIQPLGGDVVRTVRNISRAILGKDDPKSVRSMFHVLEYSNSIPSFKIGSQTCVMLSSVRAKFWSQEKRAWATEDEELLVRIHLLLTAALPLMMQMNGERSADAERLAAIMAEAVPTLQRLLGVKRI